MSTREPMGTGSLWVRSSSPAALCPWLSEMDEDLLTVVCMTPAGVQWGRGGMGQRRGTVLRPLPQLFLGEPVQTPTSGQYSLFRSERLGAVLLPGKSYRFRCFQSQGAGWDWILATRTRGCIRGGAGEDGGHV